MPNSIQFKLLNDAEINKALGKMKTFSENLPKKEISSADFKSKFKDWQDKISSSTKDETVLNKINAVALKSADVAGLRAINESKTPTAEAIVNQKMNPEKVIGSLYSSLTTLEYTKMESEFKTRMKAATTPAAKEKVQKEWDNVVKAGIQAFAAGGLKGLKEDSLKSFAKELTSNKANLTSIINIANSGVAVAAAGAQKLTSTTVLKAGFVTVTGVIKDAGAISTTIANLCAVPFAQGSFTKHFHRGFSLTVRIPYWCPTWTNPFRTCHKNVVLAGLSLDLNISVGYRVTCCGATAWGQASAQACATLIGIRFCAGCTGRITGVAGIGRTTAGGNCVYGIGVNAQLTCTFGGVTVLNVQAPFGFNVTGPCPPLGLCN